MAAGRDDDIEDELRKLRNRIKELEGILRTVFTAQEPEEREEEELVGKEDLWESGTVSDMASELDEYKGLRVRSATSQDFTLPYFGPELREDKVENYTALFMQGYENLDSLKSSLTEDEWNTVVHEIFMASAVVGKGPFFFDFEVDGELETFEVSQEELAFLVHNSGARPASFGISENVRGNVKFVGEASPIALLNLYDTFWFSKTDAETMKDVARPWERLNLKTPGEVQAAMRATKPMPVLFREGILQGGNVPVETLVKRDLLPKGLRRQRNDIIDGLPSVFEEMAEYVSEG